MHPHENARSELLTELEAVVSHGSKAIRDGRRELATQIEGELWSWRKGDSGAMSGRRGEVRGEVQRDNARGGRESRCRESSSYGRPSVLKGWRFAKPPNHKPKQHYSTCKLQQQNPPIIKSAAKVRGSNLIPTPSFANIPYRPVFAHQATR